MYFGSRDQKQCGYTLFSYNKNTVTSPVTIKFTTLFLPTTNVTADGTLKEFCTRQSVLSVMLIQQNPSTMYGSRQESLGTQGTAIRLCVRQSLSGSVGTVVFSLFYLSVDDQELGKGVHSIYSDDRIRSVTGVD